MSSGRPRKYRALWWALSVLILGMIYVFSYTPLYLAVVNNRGLDGPPYWIIAYGAPYHWLDEHTPLGSPLRSYDLWWSFRIGNWDHMLGPTENLGYSRLAKEVKLTNGEGIYLAVAELFDQPGTVKAQLEGKNSHDVCLAWESNPAADKLSFAVTLTPHTSVLEALQEIADRRGERLIKTPNHVAIISSERLPVLATYRQMGGEPSAGLESLMTALIPYELILSGADGDSVEDFINSRLELSWGLSHEGGTPFRFKMSKEAKAKAGTINVNGKWFYEELFDAFGLVGDLRWRTDGTTIYMEAKDNQ